MAADLQAMKPIAVCRLMNSTPLGEVLTEQQLRNHRTRAGLRIGQGGVVNILQYVGWLMADRHLPAVEAGGCPSEPPPDQSFDAVLNIVSAHPHPPLRPKHERAIAALLTEPSYAAAARRVGIAESTLYRWLERPVFREAFDRARHAVVHSSMARMQANTLSAVDTLGEVVRRGRRDSDRLRAAESILSWSHVEMTRERPGRSLSPPSKSKAAPGEVVSILSDRLRRLDDCELSVGEKAQLTTQLSGTLLRAIEIDTLDQRLTALETVLKTRPERS